MFFVGLEVGFADQLQAGRLAAGGDANGLQDCGLVDALVKMDKEEGSARLRLVLGIGKRHLGRWGAEIPFHRFGQDAARGRGGASRDGDVVAGGLGQAVDQG